MASAEIEPDAELIAEVMRVHGLGSEREAVDYALRRLVSHSQPAITPLTREDALAMRGTGWFVAPDPPRAAGGPAVA